MGALPQPPWTAAVPPRPRGSPSLPYLVGGVQSQRREGGGATACAPGGAGGGRGQQSDSQHLLPLIATACLWGSHKHRCATVPIGKADPEKYEAECTISETHRWVALDGP
jgi:hypothetical protein